MATGASLPACPAGPGVESSSHSSGSPFWAHVISCVVRGRGAFGAGPVFCGADSSTPGAPGVFVVCVFRGPRRGPGVDVGRGGGVGQRDVAHG